MGITLRQYVVDAFTDQIFSGNPAAICLLDRWIPDQLMLEIAKENHLSETAFLVKDGRGYRLRWFTPGGEIDLCGHATLASAYVLMNEIDPALSSVTFTTLSGELTVTRRDGLYEMEFPGYTLKPVEVTAEMAEAVGAAPREAYLGRDLLCVFERESTVRNLAPDMEKLKQLDGLLVHVTAEGDTVDCVSRSFGPKLDVREDPVCGSGHCHIVPYWIRKTGKEHITAYQASARGGTLYCRMAKDRVILAGKAVLFSTAEIRVGAQL